MHSVAEVGTNVPAFLAKLWKLVEDPGTNDLICWSEAGDSFIIHNQAQFCRELLPLYYKHNNMASFVRQLNMYGFHKKVSVDAGGLKLDRDEMEFAHTCFLRGQSYLLENIKRKIAETGRTNFKAPEMINRVLGDVKQMKGRQENLDSKLSTMKRENEALWRELALLRQKHLKQQQIVNKLTRQLSSSSAMHFALNNSPHLYNDDDELPALTYQPEERPLPIRKQLIQFLLTVVQSPGSRLGIKRRYPPLMLNDREHHHHHHHKHKHHRHGQASSSAGSPDILPASAPATPASHNFSDDENPKVDDTRTGPTIHELDPSTEYILPDNDDMMEKQETAEQTSPIGEENSPTPAAMQNFETSQSPEPPTVLGLDFGQDTEDTEDVLNPESLLDDTTSAGMPDNDQQAGTSHLALLSSNGNSLDNSQSSSVSRWGGHPLGEELDNHLETMQSDLDGLKELLRNENCSLDANTLLSSLLPQLFADDPISLGMGLPSQEGRDDDAADIIGSELISYNPTLFDLTDEAEGSESTSLFPGEAEKLLQSDEPSGLDSIVQEQVESELSTPHPKLERPDFSEPSKKRRK